jgi:hypothetical protein
MDKLIESVENSASLWADVSKQIPITSASIVPLTKTWSVTIESEMEAYCKETIQKLKESKNNAYWKDDLTPADARSFFFSLSRNKYSLFTLI